MKRTSKLILGVLSATFAFAPIAQAASFTDVPARHWAHNTINWGADKQMVSGYPDRTFKPEKFVTEAEFLVMLIRNFKQLPVQPGEDWSQPYYLFASEMHYPIAGGNYEMMRNWNISRGRVAEIVAGAMGKNYTGENAVRYLLANGLAQGKDPQLSVSGFKKDDDLTRAEAVQFIKTAMEKGLTELKARPVDPSTVTDEMAKIPVTPTTQPKPVEQPKPAVTTPVLHEKPASELKPWEKGKLAKDPVSQPAIDAFLKNVKFDSKNVSFTIPEIPNGYTAKVILGTSGEKNVKEGETFSYPYAGKSWIGFVLYKGYEGKNHISVDLPSGAYTWGAER